MLERAGRLPHTVVACVGGGSNAMGIFSAFLDDPEVELVGVEAAGRGARAGRHSATLSAGTPGRAARQPELPAAGRGRPGGAGALGLGRARLPGRGPGAQLAPRHAAGCATNRPTTRRRSTAFQALCRLEGIIPALETAHAFAWVRRQRGRRADRCVGAASASAAAGDKDVAHVAALLGEHGVTAATPHDVVLPDLPGRRADAAAW